MLWVVFYSNFHVLCCYVLELSLSSFSELKWYYNSSTDELIGLFPIADTERGNVNTGTHSSDTSVSLRKWGWKRMSLLHVYDLTKLTKLRTYPHLEITYKPQALFRFTYFCYNICGAGLNSWNFSSINLLHIYPPLHSLNDKSEVFFIWF